MSDQTDAPSNTAAPTAVGTTAMTVAPMPVPDTDVVPETLALTIPICAVVLALTSGMLKLWLDFRRKREAFQLHHAERMAAIEKGIDVPPLPAEFFQEQRSKRVPADNLKSGLTSLFIGIAVVIALRSMNDAAATNAWWGLVPVGYGLALIIYYFAVRGAPNDAGNAPLRDSSGGGTPPA
jgi:Domain of unknown function (DUF6249)